MNLGLVIEEFMRQGRCGRAVFLYERLSCQRRSDLFPVCDLLRRGFGSVSHREA